MPEGDRNSEIKGTLMTVGVLCFRNDFSEVLLVQHGAKAKNREGIYGLPAGKIALGQSPREAAAAELLEETGLHAAEGSLHHYEGNTFGADLERHYQDETVVRHGRMDVFYCDDYEGELEGDEKTQPVWKKISELPTLYTMPNVPLAIQNFLKTQES